MKSGKVSKALERKIVMQALGPKFTPAQIHQILKPPKEICEKGKRKGKRGITRSQLTIFPKSVSY